MICAFICSPAETASHARARAAARLYRDLRDSVKNGTVEDAARAIADALFDYGYDKDARNFYITLPDVAKNPDAEPFAPGFSASWTGGARAYPF